MRIIAYRTSTQNGKVLLEESTGEYVLSNDIDQLFSFLLEDYNNTIRVCWDLDATVSAFLRLLGKAACRQLMRTKKYYARPYSVFYIPDKIFSVSYGSRLKCNLYGLEQYYPDLPEPDVKEVKVLGDGLLRELDKMGFKPSKLTSPVAVYEECVLNTLDLPKIIDIPPEVAQMAYMCSARLWIESHQIGYWQ